MSNIKALFSNAVRCVVTYQKKRDTHFTSLAQARGKLAASQIGEAFMIDRTAEDIAQDNKLAAEAKQLAQLSNKIDELQVSLDHVCELIAPLAVVVATVADIKAAIKRVENIASELRLP